MSLTELEKSIKDFIEECFPKIETKKKYGGTLFNSKGSEHFCGLFVYKTHVSLEFSFGYKLNDPKSFLQGTGKYRRHLKYTVKDEVPFPYLKKLLKEACKLSKI